MELKRSFSCPSPSPALDSESPLRSTPPHHFKVPNYPSRSKRRTPKQRNPRPQRTHPYHHLDGDYPSLLASASNTHPSLSITSSPSSGVSYAQATQPRTGKRSTSERLCLSPIDYLPKRTALSCLQSPPPEPALSQLGSTPKDHFTDELMEVCEINENTPGGGRSVKVYSNNIIVLSMT